MSPKPLLGILLAIGLLLLLPAPNLADARSFAVDRQDDEPTATACDGAIANDCSLRGAIGEANLLDEASTITIPAGHYLFSASSVCRFQPNADPNVVLTSTGPTLCLSKDIALVGAGVAETILDANEPAGLTSAAHPVFIVNWGTVTSMEGLTVTKGNWTAGAVFLLTGGGIWNGGTLTLTDVAVTDNYGRIGGGIMNRGTLTLQRVQLARNTGTEGGGVYNYEGGAVTASDTEASFNNVSNIGGAFNNANGTMTIVNSTLHDNDARNGGGLGAGTFTTTTLINTTISGNRAFDGGGIQSSGTLTLRSCTVTANTAQWASDPGRGSGGGISAGATTVSNSILAGNFDVDGKPDCNASLNSEGHNLIENTTGCAISGPQTGDLTGVSAQLGALAVNGGPAPTHVPEPDSPAIDGGDPAAPGSGAPACPAADQRGLLRPTGVSCDIGAVEVSEVFGLSRVLPGRGGAGGTVLLHVAGNGFEPGATVRLERAGQAPIDGAPVQVEAGRSSVTASVDLMGAAEGAWDVVVTNPDDVSERLDAAFVVEPSRAPDMWLQVVGPRGLRPAVPTPITLVYGNRGNVDALGVPLTLSVAEGMVYRLLFPLGPPPVRDPEIALDWTLQPMEVDLAAGSGGTTNLTFLLPVVPAGATGKLQLLLTLPPALPHGDSVSSFASVGRPLMTPQPTDATVNAMVAGARAYIERIVEVTVPDELDPTLALYAREQLAAVAEEGRSLLVHTGGAAQQVHSLAWLQIELALRAAKASLPEEHAWFAPAWSRRFFAGLVATLRPGVAVAQDPSGPTCAIVPCSGQVLTEGCGCLDLKCDKPSGCGFPPPIPNPPGCNLSGRLTVSELLERLKNCRMTKDHCESLPNHRVVTNDDGSSFCVPNDPGGHCPRISLPNPLGAGSIDCLGTPIRTSHDPNDKTGVAGIGDGHFLLPGTPLAYTIAFENDPQLANAAAQVVTITDQLDPAQVDLSSFALGSLGFGSVIVPMPAGAQKYSGGVDLRPAQNLLVTIDAGIDLATGLVHWTFTSVDPATMELTTDPDAGFLPVNTTAPEGEGSVSFTVMPKSDLASGTSICNGASIIFDVNEPLVTPTWCNGFDATPPASAVAALPATQVSTDIALTWSGSDAGAGVASYTIYVSTNAGPFTAFLTDTPDTAATFAGVTGSTYAFYSVALDGLGHREAAPLVADAQTTIGAGPGARDLAITNLKVAKSIKLSAKKPSHSVVLTVRIQNRGTRQESIPTAVALATLVDLEIESLGACAAPTPALRAPRSLLKKPLLLKPKKSMTIKFEVPIGCANDPAKSPKGETSAHDFRFVARLGTFGGPDAYETDDECPRAALGSGSVTRPAGDFPERGCGAPLGRKTFGGPVLLDVVGPGARAP